MANVVIWVTLLLTASCVIQAVPLESSKIGVQCEFDGATITLNLTGRTDAERPSNVYINGQFTTADCNKDIAAGVDTPTVAVVFADCSITSQDPTTEFTLYFSHANFISSFVTISCHYSNTDGKTGVASVNNLGDDAKSGELEKGHEATNDIEMTLVDPDTSLPLATGTTLGQRIDLTLTATGTVSFEVTGCTVQSTRDGGGVVGPFAITIGWCTADAGLLTTFRNDNSAPKTSTSTITAFRLVNQAADAELTFTCNLKWCADDAPPCDRPDPVDCSAPVNRRRRSSFAEVAGDFAHEKTLTTSLKVYLPGMGQDSGTNAIVTNGHVILVALLLCGFKYIM